MEPTLAQIKEYVREQGIDVFSVLNMKESPNATSLAFGSHQTEIYFQYYLEHSTEIVDWLNKTQIKGDALTNIR